MNNRDRILNSTRKSQLDFNTQRQEHKNKDINPQRNVSKLENASEKPQDASNHISPGSAKLDGDIDTI